MSRDGVLTAHSDFDLVERNAGTVYVELIGVSEALRTAWAVPTDSFVTADIPLLLTRLSIDARNEPDR